VAEFRLDQSALRELLGSADGPVARDMKRRGDNVMREAKRIVPKNNGTLGTSITTELHIQRGVPVVYVGSPLEYAIYVHEGTGLWSKRRPGPIRPVKFSVLKWPRINNSGKGNRRYKGGKTQAFVYAKRSAGSPPKPFLTNALPRAYD
jgi:hypothetical protein